MTLPLLLFRTRGVAVRTTTERERGREREKGDDGRKATRDAREREARKAGEAGEGDRGHRQEPTHTTKCNSRRHTHTDTPTPEDTATTRKRGKDPTVIAAPLSLSPFVPSSRRRLGWDISPDSLREHTCVCVSVCVCGTRDREKAKETDGHAFCAGNLTGESVRRSLSLRESQSARLFAQSE